MDKETREFLERKFSTLDQRFNRVDEQFSRIDQRFTRVDEQLAGIDQRFTRVDEQLTGIDRRFGGIDEKFEDTKRYFGVVAEGLRSEVQQVAEGHQIILDGQTRIVGRIEQAERELGAMIRFSYSELDRRIRTLEEEVLTLQTRVDRIEAGQR